MSKLQWRDARVDLPKEGELCIVRYPVPVTDVVVGMTMYFENKRWREWNESFSWCMPENLPYWLPMPEEPDNG